MVNQTSQQIANDLAGHAFSNDARDGQGESLKHDTADHQRSGFTEIHGGKSIQKERSMLAELDPNPSMKAAAPMDAILNPPVAETLRNREIGECIAIGKEAGIIPALRTQGFSGGSVCKVHISGSSEGHRRGTQGGAGWRRRGLGVRVGEFQAALDGVQRNSESSCTVVGATSNGTTGQQVSCVELPY